MKISWFTRLLVVLAVVLLAAAGLYVFGVTPYKVYVIHTGSMDSSIPSGSAVIVNTHQREPKLTPGSKPPVVTFVINGAVVTHRLVSYNADGTITTKGDANRSDDPWHAPKANIIGTVVASPRYLGFVLVYLFRTTGGLSIALLIIAIWLIATFPRTSKEQPAS